MRSAFMDRICEIVGYLAVVYGISRVSTTAAWILGGILLIVGVNLNALGRSTADVVEEPEEPTDGDS